MIITKEHQEAMLAEYMKENNIDACMGFYDGMKAILDLIKKCEENENL